MSLHLENQIDLLAKKPVTKCFYALKITLLEDVVLSDQKPLVTTKFALTYCREVCQVQIFEMHNRMSFLTKLEKNKRY